MPPKLSRGNQGNVNTKIHDRDEEYALVTQPDLEEIADFGWFEHLLTTFGAFMFGGAFWNAIDILASQKNFELTPWIAVDCLAMASGGVLFLIGHCMYRIKQRKIKKYFPKQSTPSS